MESENDLEKLNVEDPPQPEIIVKKTSSKLKSITETPINRSSVISHSESKTGTEQIRSSTSSVSENKALTLQNITSQIKEQIEALDNINDSNYKEVLAKFQDTIEQATLASEEHALNYIKKAQTVETALETLAEYNSKALEQLSKLTKDTLEESIKSANDKNRIQASEKMVEKAKLLVQVAEKQLEYSKRISNVARPLTLWRLDASKAVWEAQKALQLAEQTRMEAKEKEGQPTIPKSMSADNPTRSSHESIEPVESPDEKPPIQLVSFHYNAQKSESSSFPDETESEVTPINVEELMEQPRQPIKVWPKHVYATKEGKVICYVRAPTDCLMQSDYLDCQFSEPFAPWPVIPGHNEVIGSFVSIRPVNRRKICILPNEPWIVGIPHNYGRVAARETVLFAIDAGEKGVSELRLSVSERKQKELVYWHDLSTTDVVSDETHYLEVRWPRLSEITFAPCVRLKRDLGVIGNAGGKLVCLSESRVTLTAPKDAVKAELPFSLQVQQLDCNQIRAIREQNKSIMDEFIVCSPLIYLVCANKVPFKPMILTLPFPDSQTVNGLAVPSAFGEQMNTTQLTERVSIEDAQSTISSRVPATAYYDDFQKSLLLPQLLAGPRKERYEVTLMQKLEDPGATWKVCREGENVENETELSTFNLKQVKTCRFLAVKTRVPLDEEVLSRCASILEQSLSQHLVFFTLRQHAKQPTNLCLVLSLPEQLESAMQFLNDEGYTDGVKSHGPVFLNERQRLDLVFHSNIVMVSAEASIVKSRKGCEIIFNSAQLNRHKFTIGANDPFAQHGLDHYRGFLDIYCMRQALAPAHTDRSNETFIPEQAAPRISMFGQRSKKARFQVIDERTHLARMVMKLPKAPSNRIIPSTSPINLEFKPTDVVTPKYLRDLSKNLCGDAWRRLGAALDLSRITLQAIDGSAQYKGESPAYVVLSTWIKRLPVSANRFNLLHRALTFIGRADLANDLRHMYSESGFNEDDSDDL